MPKLSVDQALLRAKSHAKKGEIKEAQKLYQMVLQAFPKVVYDTSLCVWAWVSITNYGTYVSV